MRKEVSSGVESREIVKLILHLLGTAHLLQLTQHIHSNFLNLKHGNSASSPSNPGKMPKCNNFLGQKNALMNDSFFSWQTHKPSYLSPLTRSYIRDFRNYFWNNYELHPSCLTMHSQSLKHRQQHLQHFRKWNCSRDLAVDSHPDKLLSCPCTDVQGALLLASPQTSQPDLTPSPLTGQMKICSTPSLYPKALTHFREEIIDSRFSLLVLAKVCSPPYLQSFFIQHPVFALNLVSWPFLFSRVFCTSKNWTVLPQPFRGWVLGTGKYLQRNKEELKNPNNQAILWNTRREVNMQSVLPVWMDRLGLNGLLRAMCTDPNRHGLPLLKLELPELFSLSLKKY